jgi:hypothetical protein
MREAARSASAAGRTTRLRSILVVGEFALALVLLVGAALLVQSFWRLQHVSLGFNPASVLTARLWLPQPNLPESGPYFTHDARVSFYTRVLDRIAALPGVEAVGGVTSLPLAGAPGRSAFTIEGRPATTGDIPNSEASFVTPGYFRALGVDLVRGVSSTTTTMSTRRWRWSSARVLRGSSFRGRTRSASASVPAREAATPVARSRRRRSTG